MLKKKPLGKKQTNQWAGKTTNGQKNKPMDRENKLVGKKQPVCRKNKLVGQKKTIWIKSCIHTSLVCFAQTIQVEHFDQQNLYGWVDTSQPCKISMQGFGKA